MYPLFESVCIENSQIKNVEFHEARFNRSYIQQYKTHPTYTLFDGIHLTNLDNNLKYKLRIGYKQNGTRYSISEYESSIPKSLKLVTDNTVSYALKKNNRKKLNALFQQREEADDVLIIKNGLVTDASYSNILLFDGKQIVTPSTPLLAGTCRARLLAKNSTIEQSISVDELQNFESFQLVNALNDFDENRWIAIKNIN
ncbi:4-amino-4-deoxychorismate lyase [Maribacter caenipelagi]|uniref:4-amino-4-deoxychorismate lyase n=1 Tax=Maribacter caenipelagi TaxID=1447781 RepID=A0A4R7CSA5_9FLAO|nr:aminotransferase class IV [Maribacter caenipelagi]TDS10857.1 4-amino-4-deoxychorismate lyase [Maribacter caenipelagi]